MSRVRAPQKKTAPNDSCPTPDWLYRALHQEFRFDLDPCPLNPDWTVDGLQLDWNGRRVFCNPPYSHIRPWVEKAVTSAALTVFLVPSRFNSTWARLLQDHGAELRMLGTLTFTNMDGKSSGPYGGVMVAIVRRLDRQ